MNYLKKIVIILKMLRELQENRDKQLSKIWRTVQEQKENFNRDRKCKNEPNFSFKLWNQRIR